jgi:hypothetical protein
MGPVLRKRVTIALETRLDRRSVALFSAPSASLQRGLNPGGETHSDGTMNKGGFVVSPRPSTMRGGTDAISAATNRSRSR